MTDDTPTTLRDEVLRVLAGIEEPMGLADIASVLHMTAKEDRLDLAKMLHKLKAEGAIIAEGAGGKGRRFNYRVTADAETQTRPPHAPTAARRRGGLRHRPQPPRESLHAACEAMEQALAAMVKDAGVMAVVRAYGALREAMGGVSA